MAAVTAVKPPTSAAEFDARYMRNMTFSGHGTYGATQHFPCPFCAAEDWYVVRLIDFAQTSPSLECSECGRSTQLLYTTEEQSSPGLRVHSRIEMVQTGGPDPPEWHRPKMRRADPVDIE